MTRERYTQVTPTGGIKFSQEWHSRKPSQSERKARPKIGKGNVREMKECQVVRGKRIQIRKTDGGQRRAEKTEKHE